MVNSVRLLTFPIAITLILSLAKLSVKFSFDCNTTPTFSEKRILIKSFSAKAEKSISIPTEVEGKHISKRVVINPPDPISCPAVIIPFLM